MALLNEDQAIMAQETIPIALLARSANRETDVEALELEDSGHSVGRSQNGFWVILPMF